MDHAYTSVTYHFSQQEGSTVTRFMTRLWLAWKSRRGQSLVEYALILALVAIVVITALTTLGGHASNTMNNVSASIGAVGA
jgi:pilus assembly protein Flp/PilA